eukprot:s207_g18.t1
MDGKCFAGVTAFLLCHLLGALLDQIFHLCPRRRKHATWSVCLGTAYTVLNYLAFAWLVVTYAMHRQLPLAAGGLLSLSVRWLAFSVHTLTWTNSHYLSNQGPNFQWRLWGMMRITRHPWMISYIVLCATEILLPRFQLTSDDVAMLGLHVLLPAVGIVHMDLRLRAAESEFFAATSFLPFLRCTPATFQIMKQELGPSWWIALRFGIALLLALAHPAIWFLEEYCIFIVMAFGNLCAYPPWMVRFVVRV